MRSNLTVTSYRPTFGIKTSASFINRTSLLCTNASSPTLYKTFLEKVNQFESKGLQDYTIDYKLLPSSRKKNERHVLYAYKNGSNPQKPIVIAQKSKFNYLLKEYLKMDIDNIVESLKKSK